MTILDVHIHPDAVLRTTSEPVTEITPEILQLLDDMIETMYAEEGIGLAAPQIGLSQRIVVVDVIGKEDGKPGNPIKIINPEIISVGAQKTVLEEGCLSLPEMRVEVERPSEVTVRYMNEKGETVEMNADGLLAKCIQHEIDHLNGKLIFDYLSSLKRDMVLRKYQKNLRLSSGD